MSDPRDDGAVIYEESPLDSVDFTPRIVRTGRRGGLMAAALAVTLAGIVGVGVLAGRSGLESGPEAAAASTPAATVSSSVSVAAPTPLVTGAPGSRVPTWPPSRGFVYLGGVIDLRSPVPSTVDLNLASINVEGTVLVRAARIDIALRSGSTRIIDRTSIDVRDPDGGIRPVRAPTFMTSFDLPEPRTGETLWVVVTAYNDSGVQIGAARRPLVTGRQPGA
ncbi:MAG: hypothetical protein ABI573_02100 [Chloroflexota bacterium]